MTALNLKSRKYETKKSAKRLLTKPDSKYYKQDTLPAGGMNSLSLSLSHTHCVTLRIKTETESTKVQLYLIDTIIEHLKKKLLLFLLINLHLQKTKQNKNVDDTHNRLNLIKFLSATAKAS
jgi:hypothetical protein